MGMKLKIQARAKINWTLDGEFGGALRKAEIRVCPKALGILR